MHRLFLFPILIVFIFTGCTLTPEYKRPDAPVPNQWPTEDAYKQKTAAASAQSTAELPWRDFIADKRLQKVIETALTNNRDLRIASLNVDRAQAYYGIQRAGFLPSVQGIGNWTKQHVPGDLSSTRSALTTERYDVNLGISSWEIDFFGRIRSLKDQALESYLATEQAHRSAQILLITTTVQAYMTLAADRETLTLVASTLESQKAAYNLIKKRYDVGVISELDLRRAQSQMETARGNLARYTQVVAKDENVLNLLVGCPVPQELLPLALSKIIPPKTLSPGLSSEVLLHRPDVLAAEHRLKAANANIGAARAAFFPRISLTAAFGTASAELSGLFKGGQKAWNFTPRIAMPIFDARTWSSYEVTKVEKELAVAQYEKAIQTAFREVADALASKGPIDRQIEAQQALVDTLEETYRLAGLRYEKGIDSYLSVLDAQRSLYGAKQGLISLRFAHLANRVEFYKTLGGWSVDTGTL
ncbi:MAG: efflux transporter outer membrane subunit [Deltaproteobacteria bacterium]|nr:efflux transporter outer membrane subunit [Deltaproteobacteria bacterium]